MIDLCKYKNLFGVPGEGIHAFKIYGISVWDTLIAIGIALIIAWVTGWYYWQTTIGFLLLGIVVHRVFCVRTTIDKMLFPGKRVTFDPEVYVES
jgi:hypothetical protein